MTGFEPGSSGVVSDRSVNCATATAQRAMKLIVQFLWQSTQLWEIGY